MNKKSYGPLSLLSHMSKVSEKILYNQLNNFKNEKLSNILTDAQYSLLIMIEKWS